MKYFDRLDDYIWRRDIINVPMGVSLVMLYSFDKASVYGIKNFIKLSEYCKLEYNISIGSMVYFEDKVRRVNNIILLGESGILVSLDDTQLGEWIYKPIDSVITIEKVRDNLINSILE